MIKKFEEFEWDMKSTMGAIVAGQYALSYLIDLAKKYTFRKIDSDYVRGKINDLFDLKEWKIEEDRDKITITRDYKLPPSTVHSSNLIMILNKSNGSVQFPTSQVHHAGRTATRTHSSDPSPSNKEIKLNKKAFNKILEDVNWLKEVSDNIEECFVEVVDFGFKIVPKMSIKTGIVKIFIYPQSGEKIRSFGGNHETGYAKKLTEDERLAISNSSMRCESMFDCKSSIKKQSTESRRISDIVNTDDQDDYDYLIDEVIVTLNRK